MCAALVILHRFSLPREPCIVLANVIRQPRLIQLLFEVSHDGFLRGRTLDQCSNLKIPYRQDMCCKTCLSRVLVRMMMSILLVRAVSHVVTMISSLKTLSQCLVVAHLSVAIMLLQIRTCDEKYRFGSQGHGHDLDRTVTVTLTVP